ncbi:adenine nucleotide transporter BT1, chloroplastic/mitochondrial [Dendrobium catenatum]|uniref:Adenine nucleotide transporter BT1, chloroplastic/mitochondrial n=1 Tax=Dendrobium catenatum TaxID=906689 RepID=A0A2I0W7M6_9ASPA|nr:adenine nucleotide transporter BT1, chloroplastic/mitochondrial [Dendrobium catenatum]PKU71652.1 Adenine nucleotide transporter BT1, chloroplastic/mitochondrial [Dendrobium catenatum]
MGRKGFPLLESKKDGFPSFPDLGFSWNLQEDFYPLGGLFASVGQMGVGFGISPSPPNCRENSAAASTDLYLKYVSSEFMHRIPSEAVVAAAGVMEEDGFKKAEKRFSGKLKIRIGNPSFRRLVSGAFAGAVSRTAVAPLETIRTHLMVGSSGNSTAEVFENIMQKDGWKGLFRGNLVNVIRVAPSKAIELFAYDTAKKFLTHKFGEPFKIPVPVSLIAGACAGISSTLLTYPLELLKTRLTIERDVYDNLFHAFVKILRDEGPSELYRGLTPSLIGVVPYAATNYFAYETLKKAYRKTFDKEDIGNIPTLLIGSAAAAISCSATFPLEVARKQMQVGAVNGRKVYRNMLHAILTILEKEGIGGLYKGLGPSCMKLVPAAGISFMCYEACKKILIDKEDD